MSDLIRLLPDSVANQIAAGEVVQRPASAVKELLENAVDSGATSIKLIIRDAGKALIQVTDNGCGMSERDARMCFERHATSKIRTANDLLAIRTMGFRGEALASIASISQVELRTKRTEDTAGTLVEIEGTEFKGQSPAACPDGTSIAVKNLFFNVPARRNFLKSNTLELKYIIEEFFRVAMISPGIAFTFYNNDKILHQLPGSGLKQRLVNLLGNAYQNRLVPVEQESGIVTIGGFIGKPEFAKKTRGEQYFFANGRYIRNPYLHHAVENAYRELIPGDAFPSYFIYLTVDPQTIDINIHPTKTEVNFQDARSIYAILHSAIRQSIGKFNLTPTLDFENEQALQIPPLPKDAVPRQPTITVDPNYNPFEKKVQPQTEIPLPGPKPSDQSWQKLYDPLKSIRFNDPAPSENDAPEAAIMNEWTREQHGDASRTVFQVKNRFIVTSMLSGMVIIDQQNAWERIFYERLLEAPSGRQAGAQFQMLPQTIRLPHSTAILMSEFLTDFNKAGFEITDFGNSTFVVHAIPSGTSNSDVDGLIEATLEALATPESGKYNDETRLARSLAKTMALRQRNRLQPEEMNSLVEQLFACKVPELTPDGKSTMIKLGFEELTAKFK